MQKNPLIVTASVAALILVTALAIFGVLAALGGQQSGLDKAGRAHCEPLSAAQAKDVTNPAYGSRLAELARCR